MDDQLIAEIRELLAENRKIEAIKRLREATGWGLKEAKDAVDALEAGDRLPPLPALDANWEGELLPLLQAGQKIEAIKLYRERTGRGLAESKQAVEAIAVLHGIAPRRGCAGVVLCVLFAIGWAVGVSLL